MSEDLQRKFQAVLDNFKAVKKEVQKAISTRQQLVGQLNENQLVKEELDIVVSEANIYKSVGPVLIKTELFEAKQNVSKRIDYISEEIKRTDDQISSLDKKHDGHREALQKLQHQFQQALLKAAMKA